jgi:hypothetical protein
MSKLSPYKLRSLAQAEAWVRGESKHNDIDNECCPDFSCCRPDLFIFDRLCRLEIYNEQRQKLGLQPYYDS